MRYLLLFCIILNIFIHFFADEIAPTIPEESNQNDAWWNIQPEAPAAAPGT